MQISQRPVVALVVITIGLVVGYGRVASQAQQPEPLRLSSPPAHALHFEPVAQASPASQQVQTAQGELLDVDGKNQTFTVKVQAGEMTFRYNDQTKVTGAQKGVSGLATMTGSQVTVMYRKDGQINLATTIEVRAQK